jgi:predicted ATPase
MSDKTNPILIRHLAPKNILSFGPDFAGLDLRALNLVIGPNGSGKSNLIEVVSLMRAAPKGWQDVTRKGGGVSEWIWKGAKAADATMQWTVTNPEAALPLVHQVTFSSSRQRFDLVEETIADEPQPGGMGEGYYSTAFGEGGPCAKYVTQDPDKRAWGGAPYENGTSILAQLRDPMRYPELFWLAQNYDNIRIYREWSFGRNSIFREPQQADMRRHVLEEDFSNLGLFLNRLKAEFPAAKRAILLALQDLYEGISDFEVNTNGGTVQVFLHEGDFAIPATRLSDGTLRYLCLLAILCDPEPPPLICIEEPELGLHPDILPTLADLLKSASERTQLIVTTHSDILVDAMTETPECVVVCEKHEGKTEMSRLSAATLSVWLEKYRLGDLWIKGQLGGKRW